MVAHRFVAVVGARVLPEAWASQVAEVVRFFLARGWGVGSGGAKGADQYALEAVVVAGRAACGKSVVFLPGAVPVALSSPGARGPALGAFAALGGRVVPGAGGGRAALLGRSARLARASSGVVAFLWGPSCGSVFTVRCAVGVRKPVAVVLAGGGAALPSFAGGHWVACSLGGVAAFRWVPEAGAPEVDGDEPLRTALHRIFVVPDGEPVHALMEHISGLSGGERFWFEQGVLAGDTVFVPHEALSDTPAFLGVPRLRRRFRCTAGEAAGLGELFLALEASPAVLAWYESEARRYGVGPVMEELVRLVVQLALVEECPESDALSKADRLGDGVELVSEDGHVARGAVQSDGDAPLAWHAVGSVHQERVVCPACGVAYEADDECQEIPTCPACATPNTWEARQGGRFRALVAEIDGCASLVELAALGKRLYTLALSHDQAGVAWSHYRLRKTALEAAVELGATARALLAELERAPARALLRLGARLYRLQHGGGAAAAVSAAEWRRVWQAYQARKAALAA